MKSSDEIFRLLKSLSKQEKSYFKKFVSAFSDEEGSNYLKLFDEIVNQASENNEYDEEKIKQGHYSGKFLKNFPYHKNYLYNMILSSLLFYHKEDKDGKLIRNLISQSEILYDKMMYEQSLKLLTRAKKIAIEKDLFSSLQEIISKERIINKFFLSAEDYSVKGNDLFNEQEEAIRNLKNTVDYNRLNDHVELATKKMGTGLVRNEEQLRELEEIYTNPLLREESNATTFYGRSVFNTLNMHYWMVKDDYQKAYHYMVDNVKLWEENLHKAGGRFENYTYALSNLLTNQIRTKRFEEAELTAQKLNGLEKNYPKMFNHSSKVFSYYSTSVLMITKYFACSDMDGLERHVREIETKFPQFEKKMDLFRRLVMYYFFGISNFVLMDYKKSVYWMGCIINIGKTDLAQDYQCFARIVFLISYYELGYFDSLEYTLKSVYHFLTKKKRVYKYENIILKYLRLSFRLKSKKEFDEMLIDMKQDVEQIIDDPFEQSAFDAFNILFWLESKIHNKTMLDVIRDRELSQEKSGG